jgi:hypothetical protein
MLWSDTAQDILSLEEEQIEPENALKIWAAVHLCRKNSNQSSTFSPYGRLSNQP